MAHPTPRPSVSCISMMQKLVVHYELQYVPGYPLRVEDLVHSQQIQRLRIETEPRPRRLVDPCQIRITKSLGKIVRVDIFEDPIEIPYVSPRGE